MNPVASILLSTVVATIFTFSPDLVANGQVPTTEHLRSAKTYMSSAQWDFASYEWRNVLAQDPKNLEAHLGLATALVNSNLLNEAETHLVESQKDMNSPEIDVALAQVYEKKTKLILAEKYYLEALKKRKFSAKAYRALVELLPKLPASQQPRLEKYLDKRAAEAKNLAAMFVKKGQYQEASAFYEIPTLRSQNPLVHNDYALTLLLAGQHQLAYEEFDKLLKTQGQNWQILSNGALASLSTGKAEKAIADTEKALGLCTDPIEKSKLYNNLGYIYEANQQYTKARFAYERSIELNPTFSKAKMNLAYILQKTNHYQDAIDLYKQILTLEPKNTKAWNMMGFVYELMYKDEKAVSCYRQALTVAPQEKDAYFNLGTLYKKMDKEDKAMEIYKQMTNLEFAKMESQKNLPAEPPSKNIFRLLDLFFADMDRAATQSAT